MAAQPPHDDEEDEGPDEVGANQPESSHKRRQAETGPVESNAVMETLNGVRTQIQEMGATMQAGFACMDRRIEMMAERHECLAHDMFRKNEFIREQFQALNMRFPPQPPEN